VAALSLDAVGARDWKTVLQEREQAGGRRLPEYRLSSATGPDHAPEFEFTVSLEGASRRQDRSLQKEASRMRPAARSSPWPLKKRKGRLGGPEKTIGSEVWGTGHAPGQ
jgi:hypothetical protein